MVFFAATLHKAVEKGDFTTALHLIEKGADVDERNEEGKPPLLIASELGHVEVMRLLLDHDADVDRTGRKGDTPLYRAIKNDHTDAAALLIRRGANVNHRAKHRVTALLTAASRGREAVVEHLLVAGAEIEHGDSHGRTALYLAAEKGYVNVVKQLIRWGADVNHGARNGVTPLMLAVKSHDPSLARWFVERGAEVDARDERGKSALQIAVANGGYESCMLLIYAGANPRQTTPEGLNLATAALRDNNGRLAAKLNEFAVKGVHIDMPANIMDAILSNEIGPLRVRVEAHPKDVHLRTQSNGWTPLLFAIRQGNLAMVKLLLDQGADPNICNAAGKSPMHQAAGQGDTAILKLLLEKGADIDAVYKGLTPGETAARNNHVAAEVLLGAERPLKKSSNF